MLLLLVIEFLMATIMLLLLCHVYNILREVASDICLFLHTRIFIIIVLL